MAPESIYFGMGLAAACGAAGVSERPHMRRTALVLVATWLAVIFANEITDSRDPSLAFLFIDSVAALVLLERPAIRLQAIFGFTVPVLVLPERPAIRLQGIIGLVYVAQIVGHFLHLVSAWDDTDQYLFFLAAGGWLQIMILIVGALHGRRGRLAAGGTRRRDIGTHLAAHRRSVGKQE